MKDKMDSNNIDIAGSYHLAQSIQVQDGSVVSKTLVNKPSGTVTLFAFAKEQGLSEHAAPFDAQLLVLEGRAEVSISGKWYTVSTGETILLPANLPHAVKANEAFKMLLIMIKA
jgi:quercetin dioxygenase-like cupin family protein